MATTQVNRPRTIKRLEKPRPLKITQRNTTVDGRITTVEDIVSLIDNVAMHLNNGYYDRTLQMNIVTMCNHLKLFAQELEAIYKDQLDRAFVAIRNGSQDEKLDMTTRVHLLELIELRAKQWHQNDSMNAYYSQKFLNLDVQNDTTPDTPSLLTPSLISTTSLPPMLAPGEVIKSSGKFTSPMRIPGKNYCKDEVVIRNSDSGKVNPGAKERLVQITGTSEDTVRYAEDLIKETIQRNASPVRFEQAGGEKSGMGGSSSSLNSSASDESNRLQQQQQQNSSSRANLLHSLSTNDASIGEYKYTVSIGTNSLKITGSNLNLVRTAKLVLDAYFSEDTNHFGSGVEYFTFDEEPSFTPATPTTPHTPLSAGQTGLIRCDYGVESAEGSESNDSNKSLSISKKEAKKTDSPRELTYEFLMQCANGPYAKRPPSDWERIQKECPSIIRKVLPRNLRKNEGFDCKKTNNTNINVNLKTLNVESMEQLLREYDQEKNALNKKHKPCESFRRPVY